MTVKENEMSGTAASGLTRRDRWPVIVTVVGLLAWSTYAFLTVRVDADILAEGMQVLRLIDHPQWVLSYPGQLYGGVLEYPIEMVASLAAPGDPYALTFARIVYLPLVGLMTCITVRRVNPDWSLWPVALAAAVGPAVLHGFTPIKDLYPFAWVVSMLGVTLLYWALPTRRSPWLIGAAGAVAGLGVYQHPTTALVSVPLGVAAIVHFRAGVRAAISAAAGFVVGLVPLVLALTAQPSVDVVYESARLGAPQLLPALGLSTAADGFATAILPNAWGVQFTDINEFAFPPAVQLALNVALSAALLLAVVGAVAAGVRVARGLPRPGFTYVAVVWATFAIVLLALTTFVRPVFYYGAGVAVLTWVTLAALPSVLPTLPRRIVIGVVVGLMAITSLGSLLAVKPLFPHSVTFKARQVDQVREYARAIEAAGIPFVYGTYWEALPIAFASAGTVHPLTSSTNRFPVPQVDSDTVLVAVPDGHTVLPVGLEQWPGSAEALAFALGTCMERPDLEAQLPGGLVAVECPASFLVSATGGGG